MKNATIKTEYLCPLCKSPLLRQWGDQIHPHNPDYGITIYCPERGCSAAEVFGHGNGRSQENQISNAYKIIMSKYAGHRLETTDDEPIEVNEADPAPVEQKPKREKKQRKINGLRVVDQEPEATSETEEALI